MLTCQNANATKVLFYSINGNIFSWLFSGRFIEDVSFFFINNEIISTIRIMTVPIKSKAYDSKHTFCLDKKMTTYICMSKSRSWHFVSIYFLSLFLTISNESNRVFLFLKSDIY